MTGSETDTQNRVRVDVSNMGGMLWRNNSGAYKPPTGGFVRYGLANDNAEVNKVFKSSDTIGLFPRLIRPDDVGKTIGQFLAFEIKKPGWHLIPSDARGHAQLNYINAVIQRGGIGGFITHPDQIKEFLKW